MEKTIEDFDSANLGKMEMASINGGASALQTEHHHWSGEWWQIGGWDRCGDSYPDDCCE